MGGYQRTSTLRLFDLLFLASAVSAVSLSSFKLISSNGLPLACVIAYNTPISGCTNDDFTTGNTCSSTCIAGIETTEALINSACDQVDPGDNTILILAMNGRLVNALCPNNGGNGGNGGDDNNGGGGDDNKSKTTARVTTSSARSTTTSVGRFTTIPSSSTRSTSSTSSTSSTPFAADPAQSESTTKSTSSTISKSTTSATSLPVTTGDVLTVTSTASPSRSTATTSTEAAKETDPLDNGGGGSPFDAAAQFGAATPGYQVKWWSATLAAVFAAGWVLAH